MMRRVLAGACLVLMAASVTPGSASSHSVPCADDSAAAGSDGLHAQGEWHSYGGGPANTRSQPLDTTFDAGNVGAVEPLWTYNAAGFGSFQNTPVVAHGCVYLASSTGWVIARNAETGEAVWETKMSGSAAGTLVGGVITGSPTVAGERLYVAISDEHHPRVAALNRTTGVVEWDIEVLDDAERPSADSSYSNTVVAAPVVWNGLLFQGIMADEASSNARGGWAVLDLQDTAEYTADPSKRLLLQDWTITDAEYARGYRGASIWCTGAVDTATGHVYACGGNPASKQIEARASNALLKFDLNRTLPNGDPNPNFGALVDVYKGDNDQYYPGLDRQPACDTVPFNEVVWSPTCVQMDLDFGASPSLFHDDIGRPLVGALQKSGIYHAVYTDFMQRAWTTIVGGPAFTMNASSAAVAMPAATANDPFPVGRVYTAAQPPGQMWSLTSDRGRYRWVQPLGLGTHFQSVSEAGGVVFSMDNAGFLHAFDGELGRPLLLRNLAQDVGAYAGDLSSQGVSIARGTIYAASGSAVVAYR